MDNIERAQYKSHRPLLLLALDARPNHPDTYHYALFIAPKNPSSVGSSNPAPPPTTKHHVKNTLVVHECGRVFMPWRYERVTLPSDLAGEPRLLVQVVITDVTHSSSEHVQRALASVPVRQVGDVDEGVGTEEFTCRTWVRDGFQKLQRQGLVRAGVSSTWQDIKRKALEYVERKREQGRWGSEVEEMGRGVPLLDLLTGVEGEE